MLGGTQVSPNLTIDYRLFKYLHHGFQDFIYSLHIRLCAIVLPMASVAISTHTFKTFNNLELKLDIYLQPSNPIPFKPSDPVVLFIHGGGFVGFNRQHLPPHVVQSCLLRGWPLISADYRLLPQVHGRDVFEDLKDAYQFVREKAPAILAGRELSSEECKIEKIILVGQSAGIFISFIKKFLRLTANIK